MTGHHEVMAFIVPLDELEKGFVPPDNFKPFGVSYTTDGRMIIVCRKWHRKPL